MEFNAWCKSWFKRNEHWFDLTIESKLTHLY